MNYAESIVQKYGEDLTKGSISATIEDVVELEQNQAWKDLQASVSNMMTVLQRIAEDAPTEMCQTRALGKLTGLRTVLEWPEHLRLMLLKPENNHE